MLLLGDLLKIVGIGDAIDLLQLLYLLKHYFLVIGDWIGYLMEMLLVGGFLLPYLKATQAFFQLEHLVWA